MNRTLTPTCPRSQRPTENQLTISSEAEFEKLLATAHKHQRLREPAATGDEQKQTSFEVPEREIANESN